MVIVADFVNGVDDPASRQIAQNLSDALGSVSGVDKVTSYYTLGELASLRSTDGNAAYFFVDVNDDVVQAKVGGEIERKFTGDYQSAQIYVAGFATVTNAINKSIQADLLKAEVIAIPLVIVLLIFVFGSLVAAGLPLMVGGLAILGSFFFVWLSTLVTDTSIFSLNLITGMGLGLGIDYALLMVNRFREERKKTSDVASAVVNTVNTAGRTVLFSGLTVAVVLLALGLFPQYFLRSFAFGGVVVVTIAVLAAIIALPAALNLLGDRINSLKVIRGDLAPKDVGLWSRLSSFVMRRPAAILMVVVLGLGGLFSLASGVQFGQVDDRTLKADTQVVIASDIIRERFSGREGSPVEVIVKKASHDEITELAIALSKQPNIVRVQSSAGIATAGHLDEDYASMFDGYEVGDQSRIVAISDVEPRSPAGVELTKQVRDFDWGSHEVLVGGSAAIYTDAQLGIERQLPLAAAWIVVATLILLFLFTGSVLLPIKAVILNVLSLGATLGFLSWVFMNGHLTELLGDYTVTGTVDTSSIVLIAVVAFGLSMDYELFLLSRIKEQHEAGLSTRESVSIGLQRSGQIITAAALILAVSFAAFITSGVTIMKMLGLGIAFAILLDATIVRALLVPALMRLFGDWNWWAPGWLKRVYERRGIRH